mmetsp:Transcript_9115/g.14843  ORF Transcript_9115/g.14843 Transcript_9115/m.14843 type:complete len:237 (+) Transcript_9115:178-888(+)
MHSALNLIDPNTRCIGIQILRSHTHLISMSLLITNLAIIHWLKRPARSPFAIGIIAGDQRQSVLQIPLQRKHIRHIVQAVLHRVIINDTASIPLLVHIPWIIDMLIAPLSRIQLGSHFIGRHRMKTIVLQRHILLLIVVHILSDCQCVQSAISLCRRRTIIHNPRIMHFRIRLPGWMKRVSVVDLDIAAIVGQLIERTHDLLRMQIRPIGASRAIPLRWTRVVFAVTRPLEMVESL